jgi:magnesium chelatase family protein
MIVKTFGSAVEGVEAISIVIETHVAPLGTGFHMVGLPDSAIKESVQRIESAITDIGYQFPRFRTVVNMAPADIPKAGSAYDLPIALCIMAASGQIDGEKLQYYTIMGELSLDGAILPVKGALPIAIQVRKEGFQGLILPAQNAREAAMVNNLNVYGVSHLREVITFLQDPDTLQPLSVNTREEFFAAQHHFEIDYNDVKGQYPVKRAMELSAAGGHNVLMIGPPGGGKTMMAHRITTILPPLTIQEALETTKIHSVAGKLSADAGLLTQRPFRSPHHTISDAALVGGGAYPQPGEISLAHNGVLFLDELPEFKRKALEVMRQPMEERKVIISRARRSVEFPAGFMLIASMNPCPCGYYTHPTRACTCAAGVVRRYLNRVSGPLMDRIDLQVEVTPVPVHNLLDAAEEESSEAIRERVIAARALQAERFAHHAGVYCNAQMNSRMMRKYCVLDAESEKLLKQAMQQYKLSARAYDRILKVSRTVADLDQVEKIGAAQILEAVAYRNLDRENWWGS